MLFETFGSIKFAIFKTWLELVLDMLGGFLKKANRSEFNSLHTGCTGLCLWPKTKCAQLHIPFKMDARWR